MICPLYQLGETVIDLSKLVKVSYSYCALYYTLGSEHLTIDFSMQESDSVKAQALAVKATGDLLTHWYAIKQQEYDRCNSNSNSISDTAE